MNDFEDPDHGSYQYSPMEQDLLDHDNDGAPNMMDPDYVVAASFTDADRDGLHNNTNDMNKNGYYDDDMDHDGFRDSDMDHDGKHDV